MNISLLPPEIRAQEQTRQKIEKVIFVGIVITIVLLASLVILVLLNISERVRISSLQSDQQQIQNEIKTKYQQYADLEGQIIAADSTLRTAMGRNPDWFLVLTEIKNSKPNNISLVSIEVPEQSAPGAGAANTILIKGNSPDLPSLTNWFTSLKETTVITNARFKYSVYTDSTFGKVYLFQIEVKLQPGEEYHSAWEGGA